MKVEIVNNEKNDKIGVLSVDAQDLMSKREFCKELENIQGVVITKRPSLINLHGFCKFELRGEEFRVMEDYYDYWFNIEPKKNNPELLKLLENHFVNLRKEKPKTRPVFWVAAIILVALALYVNLWEN